MRITPTSVCILTKVLKLAGTFFVVVIMVFARSQNCLAQQPQIEASEAQSVIKSIPLVPHKAIKSEPVGVEIYQYDNSPQEGRQPCVLMHGLLGELWPLFRWRELSEYLSKDPAFQKRYKLYLIRYDTNLPLKEVTEAFNFALHKLSPASVTIITVSVAGNIVRNAMTDPAVDRSIARIITMGAFFRGSPLFNSDWMQQTIKDRHLSPLCRLDRSLAYKIYFAGHKNMQRDYRWDNIDGQMPLLRREKLLAASDPSPETPMAHQPSDEKFVVYAGYLHNRYFPRRRWGVRAFLFSPTTFFFTTAPAHFEREHPSLRLLNHLIADAVPKSGDKSKIIYPLNDGISPISSSLLLKDDFVAHSPLLNEEDIANIRMHTNARRARVFDNIDHLTFIEGHRPISSPENVTDVLSPMEKPRPMFAWILKDLME